jgi:hypothetical protein
VGGPDASGVVPMGLGEILDKMVEIYRRNFIAAADVIAKTDLVAITLFLLFVIGSLSGKSRTHVHTRAFDIRTGLCEFIVGGGHCQR